MSCCREMSIEPSAEYWPRVVVERHPRGREVPPQADPLALATSRGCWLREVPGEEPAKGEEVHAYHPESWRAM
jgi:hypothetical protein